MEVQQNPFLVLPDLSCNLFIQSDFYQYIHIRRVVLLNLNKILDEHRQSFKTRLVESLADKHSISCDEVLVQFGDSVDNLLESRYAP